MFASLKERRKERNIEREILTFFISLRDGKASWLRGQINLSICNFHLFLSLFSYCTLLSSVTGDQREILNVHNYVFVVEAEDGAV